MSQTGHDPHGYNPMNYQRHYQWARSRLLCQPDNCDLSINVSNRTRSTRLQSHELSTPLPMGVISFAMSTGQLRSIDQCIKQDPIRTATIPWTINATTNRRDLVCYVNWTIAIYWSMPQTGHEVNSYVSTKTSLLSTSQRSFCIN